MNLQGIESRDKNQKDSKYGVFPNEPVLNSENIMMRPTQSKCSSFFIITAEGYCQNLASVDRFYEPPTKQSAHKRNVAKEDHKLLSFTRSFK